MIYITFTPETVTADDHCDFSELFALLQLQCDTAQAMSELTTSNLVATIDAEITASIEHALNACPYVISWEEAK